MRFKLLLQIQPHLMGHKIPINYQYELSAAIYRILSKADQAYATWLHDNGFWVDNKRFKLFTFSWLLAPYGIDKEHQRLIINSDTVEWHIGFLPEKSTQQFIQGVFCDQSFQIADRISGAAFAIREVQVMPPLTYAPVMEFQTLSPICISQRNEYGKTDYLSPDAPNYAEGLLTGLLARYKALYGHDYEGDASIDFQLIGKAKPVLVKIKADTPAQTFVKGYQCRFRLALAEELMRLAYEGGLGEKGSLGFGMIK
ncbi:MAG: CRISPR-associated endoribonuclease Cas6 [Bacteroidales bacterium]|nr:CRISPR-associated endoribonuclease Cas6 [Bacteroidales bacterium]